ncbi:leucine-rich repeat domain-containing protein [Vespertiliibacter pulmonis]|uniref:leucine-rich repeat domain-containing protein n=1 Tax=Vespertiliibacter pulmonis TaxID=1443036 RepID=UPI003AB95FB1
MSPLAQLTQLTTLWLRNNNLSDISPLAQLAQLTELNLWNNPISQADRDWLQAQLPNCDIKF